MANIWRRQPTRRLSSYNLVKKEGSSQAVAVANLFFEVMAGPQTISDAGAIGSAEAFGSHTVINMLQLITSAGAVNSAESFGTLKLTLYLLTQAIMSSENFGLQKILLYLIPSGISSAEAFGTPTVSTSAQFIEPSSIASAEIFGLSKINLRVTGQGIDSAESFGVLLVYGELILSPSSILPEEAFGTLIILCITQFIMPSPISSEEILGNPLCVPVLPFSLKPVFQKPIEFIIKKSGNAVRIRRL